MQLRPQVVESTLALQEAATITRLQTQSQGLRLVNGVLYRVGTGGNGRSIQRLPMHPLQLPQGSIGPGASSPTSGSPPATVVPQPRGLTTAPGPLQLFGVPGSAEAVPGVRIPTNVINFSDQPIGVDRRVAGRASRSSCALATSSCVANRRRGGRWMCARAGRLLRCSRAVSSTPSRRRAGLSRSARTVASRSTPHRTRAADLRAGGWRRHGRPPASPAMRGVAAGLGIRCRQRNRPIGRNLQQQRRNIAMGRAQIDFWVQFGGNPHHRVWVIGDRRAGPGTEADTAVFGSGSYPYATSIDVASFARTLPGLITSYRDFLLFLDMAKVLGTIQEDPTMPAFPSPPKNGARLDATSRGSTAPDRDRRLWHDITDIIARSASACSARWIPGMAAVAGGNAAGRSGTDIPPSARQRDFAISLGPGGQPILSDQQLLGNDPWVRSLGREQSGGIGRVVLARPVPRPHARLASQCRRRHAPPSSAPTW